MINKNEPNHFRSSYERELYLELIGAKKTSLKSEGRPVYQYRDLLFSTNREYQSIYCESSIFGTETFSFKGKTFTDDNSLDEFLLNEEEKNSGIHYYGNNIVTLEDLVYAIAKIYHKDTLEEYYNETLKQLKVNALLKTFKNLDSRILNYVTGNANLNIIIETFKKIVNISTEEEAENFSDKYIFNTTGVYEKDGNNNCLEFLFKKPEEEEHFEIIPFSNGMWNLCISFKYGYSIILKIYNGKMYITKTEDFESRTWDLKDNKTIKSPFINDEDMPWTETTTEEFSELMDTIDKMADSVALIDFSDKEKKSNRKKL